MKTFSQSSFQTLMVKEQDEKTSIDSTANSTYDHKLDVIQTSLLSFPQYVQLSMDTKRDEAVHPERKH